LLQILFVGQPVTIRDREAVEYLREMNIEHNFRAFGHFVHHLEVKYSCEQHARIKSKKRGGAAFPGMRAGKLRPISG